MRKDEFPQGPWVILLIGPPGSGKTTWRDHVFSKLGQAPVVISTDDMIERWGAERGLNYTQAFASGVFAEFDREAMRIFTAAVARRANIVVDRTNMTVSSRARFLSQLPKTYHRIGIVFDVERATLDKRLAFRAEKTGKNIPNHVVTDMLSRYEPPVVGEFSDVVIG
jgi:tRNA uridine 5-carbamoylmethylation protein Kti12